MLDCTGLMVADENCRTANRVYLDWKAHNPCEWQEEHEPEVFSSGVAPCDLITGGDLCESCKKARELYLFKKNCRKEFQRHMRTLRRQFQNAKWRTI